MGKVLETQNLPRLNYKVENLNRSIITSKETESAIKNLPTKKSSGLDGLTLEFYQIFKEELIPIFLKVFQKIDKGILPVRPAFH